MGSEAPAFRARRAEDGAPVGLDALFVAGRPLALVFADPGCAPCNALLGELADLQRRLGDELTIGVLTRGSLEHARAKAQEHGLSGVMSDEGGEAAKSFEVGATPAAVVIDGDGRVATSLALGSEAVTGVLHEAAGRRERGPRVGEVLPALELHELDGRPRDSASVLAGDRPTLLVLWNPGCGFCRSMERDLASRAARLGEADPRIVLLSTGSEQEIAALGFDFPVFQDRRGAAVRRLGARGTPSALLVAADGTLAAPPAIGREAILALMPAPLLHVSEVAA